MKSRFELELPQELTNPTEQILRQKAAERTLQKLETISGTVVIEGQFQVAKLTISSQNSYKCTLDHPVNEYFKGKEPVTISVNVTPQNIIEFEQSVGKLMLLRVYGKIARQLNRNIKKFWIFRFCRINVLSL